MSANTVPYKSVWIREYQATHYKQAVFPMFADTRFESQLTEGASIKWSYDADMSSGDMDADGGYTLSNRTVTDESLTVNKRPYAGFNIPTTEKIQDHRPTQEKWAKKAMNMIYNKIDADMLGQLKSNASNSLSAGDFGGTSGDPISVTSSNAADIAAAAQRVLTNQNVLFEATRKFQNIIKLDSVERMPVAAVPAEYREKMLLQVGFKNTGMGDDTLKSGYLGMIFGFNMVVSTSLPFSFRYTFSATPTNGKVLTIGGSDTTIGTGTGLAINWVTTIGTTAGNVLAETDATTSITNLAAFLNDIYEGTTSAKYVGFTRANLSAAQQRIADGLSATDNLDGSCVIQINGLGTVAVSDDDANSTIDRQAVHALFGTSKSIAMIMQKTPNLDISAGPLLSTGQLTGYAARHFLTWGLYGRSVFQSQKQMMVDVPIACSTFTSPSNAFN